MRFHLRRRKFSLEIDLIASPFGHGLTKFAISWAILDDNLQCGKRAHVRE